MKRSDKLGQMNRAEVEAYLHEHIPISRYMEVAVQTSSTEEVVLSAPLPPNINHRNTAFGGSISTLAILSAWTLIHLKLQELPFSSRLVVQSNQMDYLQPIETQFEARCLAPTASDWERCVAILSRRGKARVDVAVQITSRGILAGTFEARYVAIRLDSPDAE